IGGGARWPPTRPNFPKAPLGSFGASEIGFVSHRVAGSFGEKCKLRRVRSGRLDRSASLTIPEPRRSKVVLGSLGESGPTDPGGLCVGAARLVYQWVHLVPKGLASFRRAGAVGVENAGPRLGSFRRWGACSVPGSFMESLSPGAL